MRPVKNAEGLEINWINYRTGEPQVQIRMEATNNSAWIGLVFSHNDPGIRALYWEQLQELKRLFISTAGSDWDWIARERHPEGRETALIRRKLEDVSIFREEDWPQLISFFKDGLTRLDSFWTEAKWAFESLK